MPTWRERWKTLEDEEKYHRGKYLSGSRLENIFDILRTGEYAAGGYILRQRQLKEYVDTERAAGRQPSVVEVYKRMFGAITEGTRHGVKHRISPSAVLEVEGFWTGLAMDIVFDPTTYTGYGLLKLARVGKKAIPQTISHTLGEAFVPGYWMKQLPAGYGGYFDDYLDWVLRKKGAAGQAFHELKEMAQPFRKRGEEIARSIEKGISTGDTALDKYIDEVIRPHIASMREAEITRGIGVGEVMGYVPHILTKKGERFVERMGGMPEVWRYYSQKVRAPYAKERTLEGTIAEINKGFGFEFFESNFWRAMAVRTQKHTADIYTADWFKHVQEEYGISELGARAGIDFVESAHPQIKKLLPTRISQHLEEMVEEPATGFMAAMGRKHDYGMTWWKRGVTVGFGVLIHPAFFIRNVYSGVYQNWLRTGMFSPVNYYRGVQARLGKGTFETLERGKISGAEMQDILREQSVMGQPGMMDVMLEDVWERNLWQKLRDVPSWFMTETENLVRIPEFIKLAEKMTLKEARDITYETHFAYMPEFHTKFEMQVAKRAFPFYTWMSRNIPFQIERTLAQPGKLGGVGKFQQQLIEHYGMEEEFERRTEWQRNMFLIPNVFKGGKGWIGVGLPFLDLTTDIGDLYFALSPLKLIPELGYIEQDWGSREYRTKKQLRAIKRAAEGRYGTTARRLARTEENLDRLMYLSAMPTYDIAPEDVRTEFEAMRWKEPHPTKAQEYAAWIAAGAPKAFRIKTLEAPPGGMVGLAEAMPEPKWWEVWKPPPERPSHRFELLALTEEVYEASRGFKPSPKQLKYIRTGLETTFPELSALESPAQTVLRDALRRAYELPGSREARYTEMVAEWRAFKSGEMQLEYPTEEQRIESWRRAGAPEKYIQKIYRDELGKLLGVSTFTPEEIEEMGAFKPSEAQMKWAFRDTRKIIPKEQFKLWAQEHEAELLRKEELEEQLQEELTSLRTIKIRKGRDIPAALKIGGIDKLMARRRELEDMLGMGVDR